MVVQWLRLQASTAGDAGSIPGGGNKIPHACGLWPKFKKKIKRGPLKRIPEWEGKGPKG